MNIENKVVFTTVQEGEEQLNKLYWYVLQNVDPEMTREDFLTEVSCNPQNFIAENVDLNLIISAICTAYETEWERTKVTKAQEGKEKFYVKDVIKAFSAKFVYYKNKENVLDDNLLVGYKHKGGATPIFDIGRKDNLCPGLEVKRIGAVKVFDYVNLTEIIGEHVIEAGQTEMIVNQVLIKYYMIHDPETYEVAFGYDAGNNWVQVMEKIKFDSQEEIDLLLKRSEQDWEDFHSNYAERQKKRIAQKASFSSRKDGVQQLEKLYLYLTEEKAFSLPKSAFLQDISLLSSHPLYFEDKVNLTLLLTVQSDLVKKWKKDLYTEKYGEKNKNSVEVMTAKEYKKKWKKKSLTAYDGTIEVPNNMSVGIVNKIPTKGFSENDTDVICMFLEG